MKKTYRHLAIMLGVGVAALMALALFIPQLGSAQGTPAATVASPAASDLIAEGEKIYNETCIACHQAGGAGVKDVPGSAQTINGAIPALANNPFETLDDPTAVIMTLLNGRAGMPSFAGSYSDEQIAAVISYVRQSWGNDADPVDPALVTKVRASMAVTPIPGSPIPAPTPRNAQG